MFFTSQISFKVMVKNKYITASYIFKGSVMNGWVDRGG